MAISVPEDVHQEMETRIETLIDEHDEVEAQPEPQSQEGTDGMASAEDGDPADDEQGGKQEETEAEV